MPQRSQAPAFGIDFGTTNSVVAVASASDIPLPLLGSDGLPHPSIVWFGPSGVTVGADAKKQFHTYVDHIGHRFVRSIKRELGRDRNIDVGGELRPAFEVAAEIFRHLRKDAARSGWRLDEAVVTVPVYFDGRQRQEIRRAARAAGIEVLSMVHEPFAAVVGYYRSLGLNLSALPNETVLVFDWGGGTLDTTLVRSRDGLLEELATGGLPNVAGDLFDEYLEAYARNRFLQRHSLAPEAFQPTRAARDRLSREVERAKIELSDRKLANVNVASMIERNGEPVDLSEEVTRAQFEDLISQSVDQALLQVDQMLRDAHMTAQEVDKVLLIGGSSEIPLLRRGMERIFDVRAQPVPNSQTVIAEGAAVIALERYEPFLATPVRIELASRSLHTVFPRESRVPSPEAKRLTLYCTDNRDGEARLVIHQAHEHESDASRLQQLLSVPVMAELPRPYQHERVHADFEIDDDLLLQVRAYGVAKGTVRNASILDLRFGLRMR